MDPNEALAKALDKAMVILARAKTRGEALELAEAVQALHAWLSRGGFLPRAWEAGRTHERDDALTEVERLRTEVERLRTVIKTGGAMYRAERAALGIPGGFDPDAGGDDSEPYLGGSK